MSSDPNSLPIERASTPASHHYSQAQSYARQLDTVFAASWQFLPEVDRDGPAVQPFTLLPGSLDEPLLCTRHDGKFHCLSNVCTHRGNVMIESASEAHGLRCRYHGRCFHLDGALESAPRFEGAQDFPRPRDDLPQLPLQWLGPLAFTNLNLQATDFDTWMQPVRERLSFAPLNDMRLDVARSHTYHVNAHWALYLDNFLEGFHIPYVHAGLNQELDWKGYETVLLPHGTLQIGRGDSPERALSLPVDHPDQRDGSWVAALYFWLFPNLMLNVYPWGISLNLVEPTGPQSTRVRFMSYVWDKSKLDIGAGADLHTVEMEDEAVVEGVQRGVRSRLYDRGRYAPSQEQGVHHFHQLWMERCED